MSEEEMRRRHEANIAALRRKHGLGPAELAVSTGCARMPVGALLVGALEKADVTMKTFLIVEEQAGQGCDHTLACGTKVTEAESSDMATLLAEAKVAALAGHRGEDDADDDVGNNWLDGDERTRASVTVYEVVRTECVNLDAWLAEAESSEEVVAQEQETAAEKALLQKLMRKYGVK